MNDRLEEAFGSISAVLSDVLQEGLLVFHPVRDDASLVIEKATHQNVVDEFMWNVKPDFDLIHCLHELFRVRSLCLNKMINFVNCLVDLDRVELDLSLRSHLRWLNTRSWLV